MNTEVSRWMSHTNRRIIYKLRTQPKNLPGSKTFVPPLNLLTLKPDVSRVTAVVVTGLGEVAAVTLLAGLDDAVAAQADFDSRVRVVSGQGEEAVVDAVDLEKSAVFEGLLSLRTDRRNKVSTEEVVTAL
jgi:hypothetical protein